MISRKQFLKALDIIEKYNKQLLVGLEMPTYSEFKTRRKKLGLTMQDVVNNTGVNKSTVNRLESGKEVYYGSAKAINDFYVSKEKLSITDPKDYLDV